MNAEATSASPALATLRQQASSWWRARMPRERQAVVVVGLVIGFFIVWTLFIQPALRIVSEAPAQLDRLEAQYQLMQRGAAESTALRGAPRVSPQQAQAALRAATERLGDKAKLSIQGDRATLILTGVNPDALRAWLTEARSGARARPIEAQLTRGPSGYGGNIGMTLGGAP